MQTVLARRGSASSLQTSRTQASGRHGTLSPAVRPQSQARSSVAVKASGAEDFASKVASSVLAFSVLVGSPVLAAQAQPVRVEQVLFDATDKAQDAIKAGQERLKGVAANSQATYEDLKSAAPTLETGDVTTTIGDKIKSILPGGGAPTFGQQATDKFGSQAGVLSGDIQNKGQPLGDKIKGAFNTPPPQSTNIVNNGSSGGSFQLLSFVPLAAPSLRCSAVDQAAQVWVTTPGDVKESFKKAASEKPTLAEQAKNKFGDNAGVLAGEPEGNGQPLGDKLKGALKTPPLASKVSNEGSFSSSFHFVSFDGGAPSLLASDVGSAPQVWVTTPADVKESFQKAASEKPTLAEQAKNKFGENAGVLAGEPEGKGQSLGDKLKGALNTPPPSSNVVDSGGYGFQFINFESAGPAADQVRSNFGTTFGGSSENSNDNAAATVEKVKSAVGGNVKDAKFSSDTPTQGFKDGIKTAEDNIKDAFNGL